MDASQKYERPSLQQGRKNSKNEKPDEAGAVSDTDNTDNNKRRLRSVKSPAMRLKSKTLLSEETAHEGKKEPHTPRSRFNSTNNELREVCVFEPKEKDAQVTTEPVTTEPQVPQINLSGERTQIVELAKSQANKLTTTQERESVEVDSLPQENEEGRRLDWPKEKVPKTVVKASVHREPGFVDTDEELGISENVIEEEAKQREENRTQVPSNKSISNEGKESSTEESWNESETGTSDSDSEIEQEKKALEVKQKKRITTNKPTTQRKNQEKTNEMKTTKNNKERGREQLGKTKTTLENIKKKPQKKKNEGMQKGSLPVSLSGTLKAFFFNQQKRKLEPENDLSDAELLEAVEVNY
ncbi:transcriptional regulator ATRX homolog [Ambystoma mexicanum]|uniref:transcriptional regulator ATRX homolog n=1 Tax=Ambystoma mexicanum TaxID=8296 RepID=UPI0037E86DAE